MDAYYPKSVSRRNVNTIVKIAGWGAGVGMLVKAKEIEGVTADRWDDLVSAGYARRERCADGVYYCLTDKAQPIATANN